VPARVQESQAAVRESELAPYCVFSVTISGNGPLCQFEVDLPGELDIASIGEKARSFTLTGCPSIFLGTVSLSNRRRSQSRGQVTPNLS